MNIFFMALFPITAVISRALSFRVHDINSGIHGCGRKNMTCNMHVRIYILHSFMLSSYLNSQNLAYKPVQTGTQRMSLNKYGAAVVKLSNNLLIP